MRVLIFSLAYLPFIGGAELAVKEITDRLGDVEFDMLTVNLDGKQPAVEKVGPVTVYRLGRGRLAKYFFHHTARKQALKMHHEKPYDTVWAIMANQAGLAASGFKKQQPVTRYVLTLQEGDSAGAIWRRTWFMRAAYKNIYRRADTIQSISQFLKVRAQKLGYKKEIAIVPNGVDIAHFTTVRTPAERDELRRQLGINDEDRIIITTSRLVKKNGVDVLIRAMATVDATLLILGTGKLEAKLKQEVERLQLSHRIKFLGHIDHRRLPVYLQISDVFVRPSRSEGLGSSFLEAMAAGLPVIATPVGGIPDFLHEGETGLFCNVDDPVNLSQQIKRILTDQSLRQRLISNGKVLVTERYDWNVIAQDIHQTIIPRT